jgi:hypothetical protein
MQAEKEAQLEQLQTERHPHRVSVREGKENASAFPALDPPRRHTTTTNSIAYTDYCRATGLDCPILSAFRDRGVPRPTSECRRVPQSRWVEREAEREGGRARRPKTGVREVGIPRPSCSSRAQVRCACSRGLQASTWERERATSSERVPRPRPRAANPL